MSFCYVGGVCGSRSDFFPSTECFSCENADEHNLKSLLIFLFKQLYFVFVDFFFPRHVLTRKHRQAADCCAERSTENLTDSGVKISIERLGSLCTAYHPHQCFIICACLTTGDLGATSKTLKSSLSLFCEHSAPLTPKLL